MPAEGEGTVLVVSGGVAAGELSGVMIPAARRVIAADGGMVTAVELGLRVDELIGDLDSAPASLRAGVTESGGSVRCYPADKDATDLELALAAAVTREPPPRRVIVLGGTGGRLDHLLAGALLLAAPQWAGRDATRTDVEAWLGRAKITVIRRSAVLEAALPGELVSLLAVGGVAHGITTGGLLYELTEADLLPGASLGVSNQFTGTQARVRVSSGIILAIQPGERGAL